MKNETGQVVAPDRSTRPDSEPLENSGLLSFPRSRILIVGGVFLLVLLALLLARDPGSQIFKIYLTEPGAYRVTYEDLREAGLKAGRIGSQDFVLTHRGIEAPIWVADGDDGRFGPGDWIEFVGERLSGHRSFHNEYTLLDVYHLALDGSQGLRMSSPALPEAAIRATEPAHLEVEMHVEMNNFMVHFNGPGGENPEPRFWERLSHIDPEPFRHEFRLGRFRAGSRPISLAVKLRGWSNAARREPGLSDHRVDLYFNGELIGVGEWDGRESHLIEVPEVPRDLVKQEAVNILELKGPRRQSSTSTDSLIDMVLLNWIEINHPPPEAHESFGGTWIDPRMHRFVLPQPVSEGHSPAKVRLTSALGSPLIVFGSEGSRFDSRNMEIENHEKTSLYHFYPPPQESVFYVVKTEAALLAPAAIELDHPSQLRDNSRQADYIIIAHPRLLRAIEPLAAFHRREGLEVAVVAVDDIYDEFNHSVVHPEAIRDFLKFAYHEWQDPAPRFVLLVGDASWDGEGIGSTYNGGAPYSPELPLSHRNLIPTSAFEEGFRGHSASDNFFVSVDGDDHLPDMAIGRFPVAEPEEVTAIVDKTVRYGNQSDVGPWRRNILWLSDMSLYMQNASDEIAEGVAEQGFSSVKLYPSEGEEPTELTQNPLRDALDRGQLLVHFFGHGARYVWRTGSATHKNNYDLFTFDDLHELKPTAKLPLVLSMTCWSAPFDHPTADSIGEKFLRLPERGGIGFFGASWKVSSNPLYSDLLIEELTSAGTIGEAILHAKRRLETQGQVEKYNYLGDPAIKLAIPKYSLEIAETDEGAEGWEIVVTVPREGFGGRAIVDWLDSAGKVLHSEESAVTDATFRGGYRPAGEKDMVASVRAYVWNEKEGHDGIGALKLRPDPVS
ncbi:MAG: C25 family cysteine peptidase [Acidobacteriota bacterium]